MSLEMIFSLCEIVFFEGSDVLIGLYYVIEGVYYLVDGEEVVVCLSIEVEFFDLF